MDSLLIILSIFPFILFSFLLLFRKTQLLKVSLITLAFVFLLSLVFWQIQPTYILISLLKGFFIAFDIFLIIFGAIFFLEVLNVIKVIENVTHYLEIISKDYRIQIIILAWFFENFIEGTAGFGTPSAVVAPLLVGIGLSPINAVIISLLGNSTSVAFGAAGTPIRVGFAGLEITSIPFYTAVLNCIGFIVPLFMLAFSVRNQVNKKVQFMEVLPFAIWSGIAFVIPSLITTTLGQEFPSILGSVIGIILIFITIKLKIFMPKNIRTLREYKKPETIFSVHKVLFPYAFLITLLILGKFLLGSFTVILFNGIAHSFNLFNPGFAFLIVGISIVFLYKEETKHTVDSIKIAFKRTIEPFIIILSMSVMVQIMVNSGNNLSGLSSSLGILAKNVSNPLLPLWAPIIGAFGSFITGSATISNIMFGNLLNIASLEMNLNVNKVLALELVGAAAGNMIALADILAAETVVGLKHQERKVLKGVIIPCIVYVLIAGISGMLIFH
jgi:lactate permease